MSKIHYSATSYPVEKRLDSHYSTPRTNLRDKASFIVTFKYGEKPNTLYAVLDDLRIIHAEKMGRNWFARITLDGELCTVGRTKKPLTAIGKNWAQAVARVCGLKQFFHKQSFQWLSWYELGGVHLIHPLSTNKTPKRCSLHHPTQEWLNAL